MSLENGSGPEKPVFSDERGLRRHFVNYLGILAAVALSVLLSVFVVSVLVNPFLPQLIAD